MESRNDRSSSTDPIQNGDLPRDGKMQRILSQLQGLLDDLRTWIDLRLDLAILKLEQRIDEVQNNIALGLAVAFFGFFAALFTLTTVAVGVGWLLGHPFWGFLAVSVALILIVVGLRATQPEFVPPPNLLESIRGERSSNRTNGEDSPVSTSSAPTSDSTDSADPAPSEESTTRD